MKKLLVCCLLLTGAACADVPAAIAVLRAEVTRPVGQHRYGSHLEPRLEKAFQTLLAEPLGEFQTWEAVDTMIRLLDDHRALSDFSDRDGSADQVRDHAVIVLEKLTRQHFGELPRDGRRIPPAMDNDRHMQAQTVVAAWKSWWAKHHNGWHR